MISALLFASHFVYAAEDECPAAVDAAEAQNPNAFKHCDYSKTGLNGVLHRALSKKSEANEETKDDVAKDDSTKASAKKNQKSDKSETLKEDEFSSAQQLSAVRYVLVEKLATQCAKGFVVEGERYLPVAGSKAMKLELIHHCL